MFPSPAILTTLVVLLGSAPIFARPQPEWQSAARADIPDMVHATVAFHQPQLSRAEDLLMQISDPKSPNFGQYLDQNAVEDLFTPDVSSQERVQAWLQAAGIDVSSIRLRRAAAVLTFSASITQLENLFGTNPRALENAATGDLRIEPIVDEIPVELRDDVQFITLTPARSDAAKSKRAIKPKQRSTQPPYKFPIAHDLTNCSLSWTPSCIRDLYGIPVGTKAAPNNSLGIYGFGDAYNQADLDTFYSQYAQFIPQGTAPKVESINGAKAPGDRIDGEESLDLQMAYPIVYPQNITVFQTPYNNKGGLLNDFLDAVDASYCSYDGGDDPDFDIEYPMFGGFQGPAMCGTYQITNVISISFAADESTLSTHYVQRQCHEWMKLALRGVTVLAASGDTGVQGNLQCSVNPDDKTKAAFSPLFPASCPYVTAVGATQVNFTGKSYQEVAVYDPKHNFYSGGGFSNINPEPAYQRKAVSSYLAANDPRYPIGTYNKSGRAYPDVALLGANVTMSDELEIVVSGGSSAATPLFAAMINRINDERLLAGKKPIGFLNQILYQHPEVFTDITQGSNPGCGTQGFKAAKGWDPVSGLGSPKFGKLRDLLISLP